jgi:xylulokinase
MFLSEVFTETFVNATGVPIELYNNDGSLGAAIGAGIGAEIFASAAEAFSNTEAVAYIEPKPADTAAFEEVYQSWKEVLDEHLAQIEAKSAHS